MPRTYDNLIQGIPEQDIYSKWFESTDVDEGVPEDLLSSYHRSVLVDLSPEAPTFAYEEARSGGYDSRTGESRSGGSHSRSTLELHHGGRRRNQESYLPEGSFTEWEFLIPDERGTATGPNMDKLVDQSWARGRFVKLYNDDDMSVPESMPNPAKMVRDIRQTAFREGRERIKIFGTSKDNMQRSVPDAPMGHAGGPAHVTLDGTLLDIHRVDHPYRQNRTTIVSNDPLTGWAAVPDHEVQVAAYGDIRRYPTMATANLGKNRRYGEVDTSNLPVEFRDQAVSRSLALTMADWLRSQTFRKQFTADGTTWGDSAELQNRDAVFKQHQDAIGGAIAQTIEQSQVVTDQAYEQHNRTPYHISPEAPVSKLMFHSDVMPAVAESMAHATRRQAQKGDADDATLRYQVEAIIAHGPEMMTATRKAAQKSDASTLGLTEQAQEATETKETKTYSGYAPLPKKYNDPHQVSQAFTDGSETITYRSGQMNRAAHVEDFQTDNPQHASTEQYVYELGNMRDKSASRRQYQETHYAGTGEL